LCFPSRHPLVIRSIFRLSSSSGALKIGSVR
jgi:hypothetical protein